MRVITIKHVFMTRRFKKVKIYLVILMYCCYKTTNTEQFLTVWDGGCIVHKIKTLCVTLNY